MMRCERCNQVVALLGFACVCGEIATVEVERLYDQPHIHYEQAAPPERPQLVTQASSTVTFTAGQSSLSTWMLVPTLRHQQLLWRLTPRST